MLNKHIFLVFLFSIVIVSLSISPTMAKTLKASYKKWNVLTYDMAGETLCYATSSPVERNGDIKSNGEAFVIVTYRKNNPAEVSFSSGYEYDPFFLTRVIAGKETFGLITEGSRAWTRMAEHDKELIDAINISKSMKLFGKKKGGEESIDIYSLDGAVEAIKYAKNLCSNKNDDNSNDTKESQDNLQ